MLYMLKKNNEHGSIMPMLAVGMVAILGIAGLSIDMGHAYVNSSRLQNALDSAALSGARTLMLSRKDTVAAEQHVQDAFSSFIEGELASLDVANLSIEFSNRLIPFNDTTNDANFVRVRYQGLQTGFTFSRLLPGIQNAVDIGGSAVAGPIPVGSTADSEVCSLAPILMCGANSDSDCSDGNCFGYETGVEECHVLKTGSGGNGNGGNGGNGNGGNGNNGGDAERCIEDDDGIGPGNFQLARITCPGGNCVRHALAGAYGSCFSSSSLIETEPGNTVGPTTQGLNTRFGSYQGPLNASDYPPDIVTTHNDNYWYDDYVVDTTVALEIGNAYGVPNRRVLTVPVVDCEGAQNGQSTIPTLGFACFFILEPAVQQGQENIIRGQLVEGCEGSGSPGSLPGTVDPSSGPHKIILYKDPNGVIG